MHLASGPTSQTASQVERRDAQSAGPSSTVTAGRTRAINHDRSGVDKSPAVSTRWSGSRRRISPTPSWSGADSVLRVTLGRGFERSWGGSYRSDLVVQHAALGTASARVLRPTEVPANPISLGRGAPGGAPRPREPPVRRTGRAARGGSWKAGSPRLGACLGCPLCGSSDPLRAPLLRPIRLGAIASFWPPTQVLPALGARIATGSVRRHVHAGPARGTPSVVSSACGAVRVPPPHGGDSRVLTERAREE